MSRSRPPRLGSPWSSPKIGLICPAMLLSWESSGSGLEVLVGHAGVRRREAGGTAEVPGDRPGGAVPVFHVDRSGHSVHRPWAMPGSGRKGESLHALKRDLLYAHEGTVRAGHLEQQTEQAWCLTLVTNAVVAWTTEYYGLAIESMRAAGRHRRRARPTRPHRLPAAARARHPLLTSHGLRLGVLVCADVPARSG